MWMWNLTCGSCILHLSVCVMDAGSGSLMEVAPCGRAAAGRLKLQVKSHGLQEETRRHASLPVKEEASFVAY